MADEDKWREWFRGLSKEQARAALQQWSSDTDAQYDEAASTQKTLRKVERGKGMEASGRLRGRIHEATARTEPVDPKVAALTGKQIATPEERAELDTRAVNRGLRMTAPVDGRRSVGAKGTDIEGALAAGAVRGIAGDQVSAVDPKTKRLVATRKEYPSVADHFRETQRPGTDASYLGLGVNVLNAINRATGTAINYAQSPDDVEAWEMAKDLWASMANEKGRTVTEGGRVAARGIADSFKMRANQLLEENPNATIGDLLGPGSAPDPGTVMGRPLSGLNDDDFDMLSFVPELLNPAEGFAFGKAIKGAGLGLKAAGAGKAVGSLAQSFTNQFPKTSGLAKKAGEFLTRDVINLNPTKAMDAKNLPGAELQGAFRGEKGEAALRANADAVEMIEAVRKVRADDMPKIQEIIETGADSAGGFVDKLRHVDDGEKLLRLRDAAARGVDGLADSDRALLAPLLRMTADDLGALRAGGDEAFEVVNKFDDVLGSAFDLERKLGADLFEDGARLAAHYGDDIVGVAKTVARQLARRGESFQKAGLMSRAVPLEGYFPHVLKGGSYSPLRGRSAMQWKNLGDARRTAYRIADEAAGGKNFGNLGDDDLTLLHEFSQAAPRRQEELFAEAAEVMNRADLFSPQEDALAGFKGLLEQSGREAETDVLRVIGKHGSAAEPAIATARTGQRIAGLSDAQGVKLVRDVDEVLADLGHIEPRVEAGGPRAIARANNVAPLDAEAATALREAGLVRVGMDDEIAKKMPALKGKVIPEALADEIRRMADSMDAGGFARAARAINSAIVPMLLNTPGFHIRNAIYGMFQVYWAVGRKAFNPLMRRRAHEVARLAEHGGSSIEVFRLGKSNARAADLADEMRQYGLIETGKTADLESVLAHSAVNKGSLGLARRLDPRSRAGLLGGNEQLLKSAINRPVARALGAGGKNIGGGGATIENTQKAMVYLTKRAEGMAPAEAAQVATKYLFDYTGAELSKMEKGVRLVIPFYQWVRFSTQQTIEMMLKHPDRFLDVQRLFETVDAASGASMTGGGMPQGVDPRDVPKHVRERGAVNLPEKAKDMLRLMGEKMGVEIPDEMEMMFSFERPGSQANLFQGSAADVLKKVSAQMGPAAKVPAELITNRYMYGGGEVSPGREFSGHTLRPEDAPGYLLQNMGPWGSLTSSVLGVRPSPRHTSEAQMFRLVASTISMMTGQRVTAFDVEREWQNRDRETTKHTVDPLDKIRRRRAQRGVAPPSPFHQTAARAIKEGFEQ